MQTGCIWCLSQTKYYPEPRDTGIKHTPGTRWNKRACSQSVNIILFCIEFVYTAYKITYAISWQ